MKYIKACPNIKHFILMPYQLILKFLYSTFQVMVTTDMTEEFFLRYNNFEVVVATQITGPIVIFWGI